MNKRNSAAGAYIHILLALGDTNVALENLSLRCGSNAAALRRPGKAKPIRDRNVLKCLALCDSGSHFAGLRRLADDPLAPASGAASIYLCALLPWPFVSGKVRIWSLFIITLTRSASCSILFPSMVTVFSPRPSSLPT